MAEPTIQLGGGNWAGKSGNLLGYYEQNKKFYAEDFTFSRSTTGTYTDSDGYIQEMPYNFLEQSNQFDTTWNNNNSTETYDSNLDAWLIEKNGIYGFIRQFVTLSGEQTLSVYAKASTLNWLHIKGSNNSAYFDLVNGVLGSYNTTSANIESVGNGFYRCSITYSGAITDVRIYPADGNNDVSGTSGNIYIQNAQLVKGTSAKTYFPTTTRLNMPRVDYLNNSNGSLILEPQRTNLITYSEDFTNSGWDDSWYPVSITSNSIISPDGSLNATLITPTSGNSKHAIRNLSASAVSGNTYTLSVFVKKGASRYVVFGDAGDALWRVVTADLDNGVITNEYNSIGTITDYENGWYRITCQITRSNSGTIQFSLGASETNSNSALPDFDDTSLTIYAFGAQVEAGSYATTLINTSGSSVTRNADGCELTNASDSIGQTEGTIYVEFTYKAFSEDMRMGITDGSSANYNLIRITSGGTMYVLGSASSSLQYEINCGALTDGQTYKAALKYKSNDINIYLNGVSKGTDTSANIGACDRFGFDNRSIGANPFYSDINQLIIYNTALSDSELATLTT